MLRFLARFCRHKGGIAATEFALILPLMLTLYFGVTEVADGLIANAKAAAVAYSAADLAGQNDNLCNSEMTDIFAALDAVMYPYPTAGTKIVISGLVDAGSGNVRVAWSDGHNASPRGVNSSVTVPNGLIVSGSGEGVILAEVTYYYSSPAGQLIYGTVPMSDTFYAHPRRTKTVTRTTTTC